MRNLRQILMHWGQLFDVKSTTKLVDKSKSNIAFGESTNGTFTIMGDEALTPSSCDKQTIVLDINAHNGDSDQLAMVDSLNSDKNNNISNSI